MFSTEFVIKFINEENCAEYKQMVLQWLESDYLAKDSPKRHFWHNRRIIANLFDKHAALVVLDNHNAFAGYMIWSLNPNVPTAEIDIVEVKEAHKRKGVFNKILAEFLKKFPNVCVLSGELIEEAVDIFENAGWKKADDKHIKVVKAPVQSSTDLPDGVVIALCPHDYYQVQARPEKYRDNKKYYQIALDEHNDLVTPIVTEFHYEGYVGVYKDKKLVTEGKAKHLFKSGVSTGFNHFVLSKIDPYNPELFKGIISSPEPEKNSDNESDSDSSNSLLFSRTSQVASKAVRKFDSVSNTATNNDNDQEDDAEALPLSTTGTQAATNKGIKKPKSE